MKTSKTIGYRVTCGCRPKSVISGLACGLASVRLLDGV